MPDDPVAIVVALADKIDMLVGFWAIGEKPTGSKDPYALRRAALGVLRLILTRELRLPFWDVLSAALHGYRHQNNKFVEKGLEGWLEVGERELETVRHTLDRVFKGYGVSGLREFVQDRLKVQLRDQGARHDLVDSVFALGDQDDLFLIVRQVEALGAFLDSDDGQNLLVGFRRAANILREEEKKSGRKHERRRETKWWLFVHGSFNC